MGDSSDRQLLSKLLGDAGWREEDLGRSDSGDDLDGVFTSDYAVLGVAFACNTSEVIGRWADTQVALTKIAKDDESVGLRDRYLTFFVKEVGDSDREGLRRMIDDTHECRKACVETRGRSLDEVLAELPFIGANAGRSRPLMNDDEPDTELAAAGLTSELLEDLGKRGAGAVLDRWLADGYRPEANSDASEKH